MARETLASLQAIIDGQKEELAALKARLPINKEDVESIIRDMMHTSEAEEFISEIAKEVVNDEFGYEDYVTRDDLRDAVRDELYSLGPEDIGAADEDHEHTVR